MTKNQSKTQLNEFKINLHTIYYTLFSQTLIKSYYNMQCIHLISRRILGFNNSHLILAYSKYIILICNSNHFQWRIPNYMQNVIKIIISSK